jgi:hypothetical protein
MAATRDKRPSTNVFWGEIAPCEHVVQIYGHEDAFVNSLANFVSGGLQAREGVIVIATLDHLLALEQRLWDTGCGLTDFREKDQYITLDATEALAKFMVKGWPDEDRFDHFVIDLIQRSSRDGRRVRAFGEMVAVLWAQGQSGATVRLEHLWQKLCKSKAFTLSCSYPKSGFTQDIGASIREICAKHSKMGR